MSIQRPRPRQRSAFKQFSKLTTRWGDNDMYGHVNNAAYYTFFDSAVNTYLIAAGALDPMTSPVVGLVVENGCVFFASLSYPQTLDLGIVAAHIGNSSVRYEIGVFAEGADSCAAQAHFIHVYVDAKTRRPVELPNPLRAALQRIAA